MKLPPVKVPKVRKPRDLNIPTPRRPRLDNGDEPEVLAGEVDGMTASAFEERYARSLRKLGIGELNFRYTFGAPRGMPGWFEVDFLPPKNGIYFAIEIDSKFTHRQKTRADKLHDARILIELEQAGIPHYPEVIHIMGDDELVSQDLSDATAKRLFQ